MQNGNVVEQSPQGACEQHFMHNERYESDKFSCPKVTPREGKNTRLVYNFSDAFGKANTYSTQPVKPPLSHTKRCQSNTWNRVQRVKVQGKALQGVFFLFSDVHLSTTESTTSNQMFLSETFLSSLNSRQQ